MKDFQTGRAPVAQDGGRPWIDAGPPPGARRNHPVPTWAKVLIVVGTMIAVVCGGGAIVAALSDPITMGPTTSSTSSTSQRSISQTTGTRSNPHPAGTRFTIPDWKVSLSATTSGAKAVNAVRKANQFNDAPAKGNTFAIVSVMVERTSGDSLAPWLGISIRFLTPDGLVLDGSQNYCGVVTKSLNDVGEMFPGAATSGNVCVQVPASAVAKGMWVVEPLMSMTDAHRVYVGVR